MSRSNIAMISVQRVGRGHRRAHRGQSLVIFAISAIVLFGICGLAVDSGISYLAANRVERAAAAGALAGVTYMPSQFGSAQTAAATAVQQNSGYVNGVNGVTVRVYKVPSGCDDVVVLCLPNRLGVDVGTPVSNTFTKLLGFAPQHFVKQSAVAEFLSTLTLGQPGPQIGSTSADINASPQRGFYFLRTEGWGTPRTQGDAYTPNPNGSSDVHTISGQLGTEVLSLPLGWKQLPTTDCGGYDFQILAPTTEAPGTVHVEVYNPAQMPDVGNTYHENDSTFSSGTKAQYDQMVYTLFAENDRFNRSTDTPITQLVVNPVNALTTPNTTWKDQVTADTLTAATATAFYHQWIDVGLGAYTDGETTPGNRLTASHGAANVTLTPGTTYRLRVDTYDGTGKGCGDSGVGVGAGGGHKGYAVRVTDKPDANPSPTCVLCDIGGLGELAFYTPLVAAGPTTFPVPMVRVPAVYAGQTINIYAYDPGDVGGATNYLDIVNPCVIVSGSCTSGIASDSSSPSKLIVYDLGTSKANPATTLVDAAHWPSQGGPTVQARVLTSQGGVHPFDGRWLLYKVPIPSNYAPTTPSGEYWSFQYELSGGTASDTLTVAVGFDGPPVHLVPLP